MKILNTLSKIILLFFVQFNLLGASVTISQTKEPKIIFDDAVSKQIPIEEKNVKIIKKEEPLPKTIIQQPTNTKLSPIIIEETKKITIQTSNLPLDQKNKKYSFNESIGLIFASHTIGKYATEGSNVAMTYLVNKNEKFNLQTIDIGMETKENIHKALDNFKEKKIKKVILLLTSNSMWGITSYQFIENFEIFMPLVNKSTISNPKQNFIFGGMNYGKQFKYIASKASSNIIEIYDETTISKSLHDELAKLHLPNIQHIQLMDKNSNYTPLFQNAHKIKNSTIILNTSIVKSAIILALLRINDLQPKEIFATQLNYSPLIFNLTQQEDREKLFVTNSIEPLSQDFGELISFFGEDVIFSWVNYSIVLGLEYFMTNEKKLFGNIEIQDNQINYPVKLIGFKGTQFIHANK